MFQTLAVVFVLIGVGTVVHIRNMQIAVGMKDQHFTSAHSWVGLIATILLSCHWIVGCVAFRLKHRFPFRHVSVAVSNRPPPPPPPPVTSPRRCYAPSLHWI